mmetsp:Transcript_77553/g.207190  ORF Transcript_77553/g.207190 Transcript_77553/m.207190 type:complete len:173 (+) Transcript_77553:1231-1749(+)
MIVDRGSGCCAAGEQPAASLETLHRAWAEFSVPSSLVDATDRRIALALAPYEDLPGDAQGAGESAAAKSWVWPILVTAAPLRNLRQVCGADFGFAASAGSPPGETQPASGYLLAAPKARRRRTDGKDVRVLHLAEESQQGLVKTFHFSVLASIVATSLPHPPTARWPHCRWR